MSAVFSMPTDDSPADRQIAQLRIPPHSIEAESSVLGGLLLDNGAWDRVGDLLEDGHFYRYEHRLIYAAISTLVNANKPADVITVYEQLQGLGKGAEVGGGGEGQVEASVDARHRHAGSLEIRVDGRDAAAAAQAVVLVGLCGGLCVGLCGGVCDGVVEEVVAGQAAA